MPYPNFHACRLRQPNGEETRYSKGDREHEGKRFDVIYQKKKGSSSWEEQAYRYPKGTWDAGAARSHCKSHDGISFEAASGGEDMVQFVRVKAEDGSMGPMQQMALSEVIAWLKANSDAEGNVKDGMVLYGDVLLKAADKEDQEDELFEWVMSDYTLDRDLERIDPAGWDLKNYRKNPVVLWGHNPTIPAIGVAQDASVDKETGRLRGKIKFSSKDVDPFAWMIKEKIREGILRTGSVGFRPLKVEIVDHSDDDKDAKGKRDETRLIHRKQELYEFSIVNIPANPSATVRREYTATSPIVTSGYWHVEGCETCGSQTFATASTMDDKTIVYTYPADGAWSVRGLGYKQQPGYVDVEHVLLQKELALLTDAVAELRAAIARQKEAQDAMYRDEGRKEAPPETEEVTPEKKAALGILADMALRLDDVEEQVKGLVTRVGVAEPEPDESASFYEDLFKRSRKEPSALDKLLNPAKTKG